MIEDQTPKERFQREVARIFVSEVFDVPLDELTVEEDARAYVVRWWERVFEAMKDGGENWSVGSPMKAERRLPRRSVINLAGRDIALSGELKFSAPSLYPTNLEEVARKIIREKIKSGELMTTGCRFGSKRAKGKM